MTTLLNQRRQEPAAREAGAGFAGSQRSDRQRLHKTRLQFDAPSWGANLNPFAGAGRLLAVLFGALILFSATVAGAMDRYEALAQIESGNCDTCIGRDGEVSRYQIRPEVWAEFTILPLSAATNPFTAHNVAMAIMQKRMGSVPKGWVLECSDITFYLLWHRPATCALYHNKRKPTDKELDRAQRFSNLCSR